MVESTYNNLPLIYLDIEGELDGLDLISLVDRPAIQRNFIAMADEQPLYRFSKIDAERHIVTGPALIPEQRVYRRDDAGNEFYISFTREAIERIAIKFFADGRASYSNVEHMYPQSGIVYFESYILDRGRGVLPNEFGDMPDGTWIVSAKIDNDEVWQMVKDGTLKGFSVEGNLHRAEEKPISSIDELLDFLK